MSDDEHGGGLRLPENVTLHDYLHQDRVWASSKGVMLISSMDNVYKRRCCDWLLRQAQGLLTVYNMEEYFTLPEEPSLDDKIKMVDRRPYAWVRRLPLFVELSKDIPPELLRRESGRDHDR